MSTRRDNRNTKDLTRDLNLLLVHVSARPPAAAYALLARVICAGRHLVAEANLAEGGAR